MASKNQLHRSPDTSPGSPQSSQATVAGVRSIEVPHRERVLTTDGDDDQAEELLDLLDDDYVQRILEALFDESRPARDLVEACNASRATVYRRLNRLQEYELVTSDVELHEDGHHRKVFESTFERATIELVDGRPEVRLVVTAPETDSEHPPHRLPAD